MKLVPITKKMGKGESVQTATGSVIALVWCKAETARMRARGSKVEVVQEGRFVWIAREESEIKKGDGEK